MVTSVVIAASPQNETSKQQEEQKPQEMLAVELPPENKEILCGKVQASAPT